MLRMDRDVMVPLPGESQARLSVPCDSAWDLGTGPNLRLVLGRLLMISHLLQLRDHQLNRAPQAFTSPTTVDREARISFHALAARREEPV